MVANYARLAALGSDFQGLSLDLWGTLLSNDSRTKPKLFEAYRQELGLQVPFEFLDAAYRSADKFTDLINLTDGRNYGLEERLTIALKLVEAAGHSLPATPETLVEEHGEALNHIQDRVALELPPKLIHPSIPDALKHLREEGVVTAVASNTGSYPGRLMRLLLAKVGLTGECFDSYCFSNEVEAVKPFPQFFKALQEAMGTEPARTVHIGDNPKADGEGAQAAGQPFLEVHKDDRGKKGIEHMLYALHCLKTGQAHPSLDKHLRAAAGDSLLAGESPEVPKQLPEEKQENAS